MKTFQELYDGMLRRRESEKAINPDIRLQVGELGIQIYANSPLQFNILYGDIHKRERTYQEMDLQFIEHEVSGKKHFSVAIINPDLAIYKEKREFQLDEGIEKLAEEFPEEPQVRKIAVCLLNCSPDEL